jgi:hypothetical protein
MAVTLASMPGGATANRAASRLTAAGRRRIFTDS